MLAFLRAVEVGTDGRRVVVVKEADEGHVGNRQGLVLRRCTCCVLAGVLAVEQVGVAADRVGHDEDVGLVVVHGADRIDRVGLEDAVGAAGGLVDVHTAEVGQDVELERDVNPGRYPCRNCEGDNWFIGFGGEWWEALGHIRQWWDKVMFGKIWWDIKRCD